MLTGTRLNTLLLVLLLMVGLAIVAMLAADARGGPLDPPAAPASTGIPLNEAGSWSEALTDAGGCNSKRFKCVLGNAGVLDRETGLVWERTVATQEVSYAIAESRCLDVDDVRLGWRLPTVAELYSLGDAADHDGVPDQMPLFPGGAPSRQYWTSTSPDGVSGSAYIIDFADLGDTGFLNKAGLRGYWCVRGHE